MRESYIRWIFYLSLFGEGHTTDNLRSNDPSVCDFIQEINVGHQKFFDQIQHLIVSAFEYFAKIGRRFYLIFPSIKGQNLAAFKNKIFRNNLSINIYQICQRKMHHMKRDQKMLQMIFTVQTKIHTFRKLYFVKTFSVQIHYCFFILVKTKVETP